MTRVHGGHHLCCLHAISGLHAHCGATSASFVMWGGLFKPCPVGLFVALHIVPPPPKAFLVFLVANEQKVNKATHLTVQKGQSCFYSTIFLQKTPSLPAYGLYACENVDNCEWPLGFGAPLNLMYADSCLAESTLYKKETALPLSENRSQAFT